MQEPLLGLINYGSGNLRSVGKALLKAGARVETLASPERLSEFDAVVLPGVGAFGDCADQLQRRGLWEPLQEWLESGRPYLGICLGYQLLFESSEESPGVPGLGYFKGSVERFKAPGLKVPQIGWNQLSFTQTEARLWRGLNNGTNVYYVHSYFPVPVRAEIIAATTEYGGNFAAAVEEKAVMGVQFHPEKSQDTGLEILKNFTEVVKASAV